MTAEEFLAMTNDAIDMWHEDDEDAINNDLPHCVIAMGCYCAGHARGNPASEPCDTEENQP